MEISPIYDAAPLDARTLQEAACYALLQELKIPFARVDHEHADTMDDCAAISEVLGVSICKNLLLTPRNRSAFYLLCMAPDKPFSTKDFSKMIGASRLSFATGEDMVELLGCEIGSASILGLLHDTDHRVTLAMDRSVYEAEWFGCHPCKNTSSLRIATGDILNRFLPYTGHSVTVVDL
ncbi:MAG: prolyl-tRNA synthetase associated domain-containing protein [Oscillospiraceae bacterium]|nr:prolyl-tRNA synthetase associated domain-containing protein [Oscillospiraceae bacterium]